jgi:hypothetical protein
MIVRRLVPLLLLVWSAACESGPTAPPEPENSDPGPDLHFGRGLGGYAFGAGTTNIGVDVSFVFSAIKVGSRGVGALHFKTAIDGQAIEFLGKVTCLAIDRVNNRAWVGGVVLKNGSTHPGFTTAIHQPGRDIWFRVVDYGAGTAPVADRTTFVGFEGGAGIITSEEYCAVKPWPDEPPDARTNAILSGNITVGR